MNPANVPTVYGWAALRAIWPVQASQFSTVFLPYGTTLGDGGGGFFAWDSSSSATDNTGIWIKPTNNSGNGRWRRVHDDTTYNVKWFGAKGDNATDDQPAIQTAVNYIKTISANQGNGTLYFPTGRYILGSTVTITEVKGLGMLGDGPDLTVLVAGAFPAITTVGFWRSLIEGLQFICSGNLTGGAFQMDGRLDGQFGVQGNVFNNCIFSGNYSSKYAFTNVLLATAAGQGSENLFLDCHFIGVLGTAGSACFLNNGNNALNNTIIGGNFQAYSTGLKIASGNVNVYSCGFQSVYGYQQIAEGGADIDGSSSSVGDTTIVDGCRSESLVIYKGGGNPFFIRAAAQLANVPAWGAVTPVILNEMARGITAAGNAKLYIVTTAGTTGASEPVWPESGTVADGSVVWTQSDYSTIAGGNIACVVDGGQYQYGKFTGAFECNNVFFSRIDVARYDGVTGAPVFHSCFTGGAPPPGNAGSAVNPTAGAPRSLASSISNNSTYYDASMYLSRGGSAGSPWGDIGLGRGETSTTVLANNTWRLFGGLQFTSLTYAQLNGITCSGGTVYWCSDGASGSPGSVLASGGTGVLVVAKAGSWYTMM